MKKYFLIIFSFSLFLTRAQGPHNSRVMQSQVIDQSDIRKGENIDEKVKKNFFLKAEVSKTNCYVGEAVMATYKVFSRLNANLTVVRRPAFTGFSVLEMVDGYNSEPDVEMLNGIFFNSHLIRKAQLFPLQEGKFTLDAAQVNSRIFLRNPDTTKELSLETPEIVINVKPLPVRNQPDSFSGAVGSFSADLQLKEKELFQREPAVARLVIAGTGNFPLITDPDISWPHGVEVSEPQVSEDVNRYVYPLSGSKIFEYRMEASAPGEYLIPPISFSYFDPADGKYKTALTKEARFTVKKGRRRINLAEKIIHNPEEIPLHYYYFGAVVLAIIGWIVFQVVRSRKK